MDICNWNWSAIGSFVGAVTTLIAAFIALIISNQWRTQKRSEILALKAQQIIKYKEQLDIRFNQYVKYLFICIGDEYIERDGFVKLDNLRSRYAELTFINFEIDKIYRLIYKYRLKDHNTKKIYEKYESFRKSFNQQYSSKEIAKKIRNNHKIELENFIKEINHELAIYSELVESIEADLIQYIFHNKKA